MRLPLKSFKGFDDSTYRMSALLRPTRNNGLVPYVEKIKAGLDKIKKRLNNADTPPDIGGDFCLDTIDQD